MTRSFASKPSQTEAVPVGARPATSGAGPKRRYGRGQSKGQGQSRVKGSAKGTGGKPKVCPFFAKNGSCKKGANCAMVHSLPVVPSGGALLPTWTPPSGVSMANPFAAFSIQVGSAGIALAANNHVGCAPQVNPSVSQGHAAACIASSEGHSQLSEAHVLG